MTFPSDEDSADASPLTGSRVVLTDEDGEENAGVLTSTGTVDVDGESFLNVRVEFDDGTVYDGPLADVQITMEAPAAPSTAPEARPLAGPAVNIQEQQPVAEPAARQAREWYKMKPWGAFAAGVIFGGIAIFYWREEVRPKIVGPTSGVSAPNVTDDFFASDILVDQGHGTWLFGLRGEVRYCFRPTDPSSAPKCTPVATAAQMIFSDTPEDEYEIDRVGPPEIVH